MNNPILLILAAGNGSRFGGLKQISEVGQNGETIMDYSIADALSIGFEKIVIVIQESILAQLTEKYILKQNLPVVFSIQNNNLECNGLLLSRKKPWGTAHAVLSAKDNLDQPFLIINADDYYGEHSLKLGFDYLKNHDDNCVIVFPIEQTLSQFGSVNRAEVIVQNDLMNETIERTNIVSNEKGIYFDDNPLNQLSKDTLVSMNLWGLSVCFLKCLEKGFDEFLEGINEDSSIEYQLPTIINNAIQFDDLIVKVVTTNEEWIGLTYKEDIILAKNKFSRLSNQK